MVNKFEEVLLLFFGDTSRQKLVINGIPKRRIKEFLLFFDSNRQKLPFTICPCISTFK